MLYSKIARDQFPKNKLVRSHENGDCPFFMVVQDYIDQYVGVCGKQQKIHLPSTGTVCGKQQKIHLPSTGTTWPHSPN